LLFQEITMAVLQQVQEVEVESVVGLHCAESGCVNAERYTAELERIIAGRKLTPLFQPIVDLATGDIFGYEVLIRGPSNSPLHSPGNLFNAAMQCNRLIELEILCRDVNIEGYARLNLPGKLFLNVSPRALLEPGFPTGFTHSSLARYGIDPRNVVIELTENFPILDVSTIRNALEHYSSAGFMVALDDLGSAYAGLRLWSELKPDYVKFDKYFIQSINKDSHKKKLVQSLQEIALSSGCRTIAEGIETLEEYYTVQSLGVNFGQGYYFARPAAAPTLELSGDLLHAKGSEENSGTMLKWRSETASSLATLVPTTSPDTTLNVLGDLFAQMPELQAVPIVEDTKVLGLLHRYEVMNILASRFGRDLQGDKPVRDIMQTNPLCIDKEMPIERLSQLITNDTWEQQGNHFIITEKDSYVGMGMITDLLKLITELQIRNARYANPLTLLPGNVPINEHIEYLITAQKAFSACYFDLDNFKPFNDLYGYSRGDMVIRLVSEVLQSYCNPDCDFIGHIGGDDFMVVFRSSDWEQRCSHILDTFAERVPELYDEEHRTQGGISAQDRRGNETFYPLISLSVGATRFDAKNCKCTQHDISILATEAKKQAKKISGNALFINRRKCCHL
jgi:diguanylate cyclase (GGDEF)-like protein